MSVPTITPPRWRDNVAHWICNFALRHIASDWYEAFIEGSIRYGCEAAARDAREEASRPVSQESSH